VNRALRFTLLGLAVVATVAACGGQPSVWNEETSDEICGSAEWPDRVHFLTAPEVIRRFELMTDDLLFRVDTGPFLKTPGRVLLNTEGAVAFPVSGELTIYVLARDCPGGVPWLLADRTQGPGGLAWEHYIVGYPGHQCWFGGKHYPHSNLVATSTGVDCERRVGSRWRRFDRVLTRIQRRYR
jgi:hypothetical protein